MSRFKREWEQIYKEVRGDIFRLCHYFDFEPTDQQGQLLEAVQWESEQPPHKRKKQIAAKSGLGLGKTAIAVLIATFRTLYNVGAMTIVTAPTMSQLRDVFMAEARRRFQAAHPVFQRASFFTSERIVFGGVENWMIRCRTASKSENLQGYHEPNMTFIVDETSGVSAGILDQVIGTLTNENALLVCIGNPNCVTTGSMIYDPKQGYLSAKDLAEKGACSVVALNEKHHTLGVSKARAFYSGEKECCLVETWAGQSIDLSTDHPVYTQRGWVHAGKLTPDDWVAMPRELPEPTKPLELDDAEVKLLAYALTDSHTRRHFTFSQIPGPVHREFQECVAALGGETRVNETSGRADEIRVNGMGHWLRAWGLWDSTAHTKRVPSDLFRMNNRQVALFLNRFWSCDGSFHCQGPKLTMCNRKLVQDIQTLLLRLGIHSRIRRTVAKPSGNTFEYLKGREFEAWMLSIYGQTSVERWKGAVGEVLGKEGKCPELTGIENSNTDVLPLPWEEFQDPILTEAYGKGGKGNKGADPRRSEAAKKYRRVRYLSVAAAGDLLEETKAKRAWRKWVDTDIYWVRVERVTSTGKQPVYDLTVPARGNFVCDNIVVHNSRSCRFYDFFNKDRELWHTFTFNAEHSPLVSKEKIAKMEKAYGRNSTPFRVRILGEFPDMDPNCVISSEYLEKCASTDLMGCAFDPQAVWPDGRHIKQFGIDLARYGSDESVIYRRSGNAIVEERVFVKTEPSVVIKHAFRMQLEAGWKDEDCWYVFDAGGIGQGVAHMFYDAGKNVVEFHNAGSSNSEDFADKITEAWFTLARLVAEERVYIPIDNRLVAQLTSRQYVTKDIRGQMRLKIEGKEEYNKRMIKEGRSESPSPDRADAMVMAFYNDVIVAAKATAEQHGKELGAGAWR